MGHDDGKKRREPELHWLLAFFVYFSYATVIVVSTFQIIKSDVVAY